MILQGQLRHVVSVHFLLSPAAKTINLVRVARMSKAEAQTTFACIRWSETDGKPVCPQCGSLNAYDCRRPNGAPRWRCRGCKADFSLTSSTLFASHKMPLQTCLLAIAIFVNERQIAMATAEDHGGVLGSALAVGAEAEPQPDAGRIDHQRALTARQ